jgi:hypothetical protein
VPYRRGRCDQASGDEIQIPIRHGRDQDPRCVHAVSLDDDSLHKYRFQHLNKSLDFFLGVVMQ